MIWGITMTDTIIIGADHGGFYLKEEVKGVLAGLGFQVMDTGADTYDADDDYPEFASKVAASVSSGEFTKGIIICGSGVGASITANKFSGVRAGLCHDSYSAHQGVEHDDMNILCLGARVVGIEVAKELIGAFVQASFTGEERHRRRLGKLIDIERKCFQNDT